MKKCILFLVTLSFLTVAQHLSAQGTAFTYQGRLNNDGSSANGNYDFSFALFNNSTGGSGQVGNTVTNLDVGVTNGLFTVTVDFGANFPGANRWLAIGVRTNGGSGFTALSPLQELNPTPYAIYAPNAGAAASASSVAASNISGTIPLGQLAGTVLTNGGTNVTLTGTFAGNGAGLTNLAAWQLAGNTGTTGNNFLGTTDNQSLQIRVGGALAGLFTPSNGSPNIVLGAAQNVISNGTAGASILGGSNNVMGTNSSYSVIGGGNQNGIQPGAGYSFVGSGFNNTIQTNATYSVLGGGYQNGIQSGNTQTVLGGGYQNSIQSGAIQSVLVGGYQNSIQNGGGDSFLGGGEVNSILSGLSFIGGGYFNSIAGSSGDSVLVGGSGNSIASEAGYSFLGGGQNNTIAVNAEISVIGGGANNKIVFGPSVIGGGVNNTIGGFSGFIGGGGQNTVGNGQYSTLGGGFENSIVNAYYAFLGAGLNNTNSANNGSIAGGQLNLVGIAGLNGSIGGGQSNTVNGNGATVPGGASNLAGGQFSFAAGANAQAVNSGAFVWADAEGSNFISTNANSFNVRASGGAHFVTGGVGLTVDGSPVLAGNNGSSLVNLNASQLTSGTVPLAQLPPGLVTNGEPLVTLDGLFLTGNLLLPIPATISSGLTQFVFIDNNANTYYGSDAGSENRGGTGGLNTGIGFDALNSDRTGSDNTAVGGNALAANGSGIRNVAIGTYALADTQNDSDLVAIGFQALQNDNAGSNSVTSDGNGHNTAIGYQAMFEEISGVGNTATGYKALEENTNGSFNTANGDGALTSNTSGSFNVAIGDGALQNSTDDGGLVAIGFDALQNDAAAHQTISGFGGNSAIGYEALQSDSTGEWNTAIGYQALNQSTGGSENTAIGYQALQNAFGSGNIAIGVQAGINVGFSDNDIDIGNTGTIAPENGIIRIGQPGVQTATYLIGTVNVPVLNITGGSDLAEPFQIAGVEKDVPEGAVVVIDEQNPGHLKMSDIPYDSHVAGVVSGANGIHPGIQMQQQGLLEGGRNVALTGRVYVQADASNGAIKPGDLLTTSSTPGRAMKVSDHLKAQGAILGKAMTGLKTGNGMVLVLVTLQ